ncbi:hypothetical protein E2320_006835 [Naja naja]|nr:hypothetical protein E2320_006835 [Naja naja]
MPQLHLLPVSRGCSWEELLLPLNKMPSRTNLAASIPSSKVKQQSEAIALATVLFLIGTLLIIIGALLLAGYISQGNRLLRFQRLPGLLLRRYPGFR